MYKVQKICLQRTLRELGRALDDPIRLIKPSSDGLFSSLIHTGFFFSRFDLYKDSNTLFTKLFTKKNGSELEELPFEEAKRNWENFLEALRVADKSGYAQFTETDLEAAAMSFIHQKFSDKYFPNETAFYYELLRYARYEEEASLGILFHNNFDPSHYVNPHFTLTPENPYHQFIMGEFLYSLERNQFHHVSLKSKEFVLKIWRDVTEEISKQGTPGISSFVFLRLIVDFAIIEYRSLPNPSLWDLSFLRFIEEAAREDDRLAQLVKIINSFPSTSNLENYRQNLLQQFRETPRSQRDQVTHDLLSHSYLEELISEQIRQEDWRNRVLEVDSDRVLEVDSDLIPIRYGRVTGASYLDNPIDLGQ